MPKPEPDEPDHFGFQPDGSYAPGPTEIARECAKIRAGLSPRELARRAAWAQPRRVEFRELTRRELE